MTERDDEHMKQWADAFAKWSEVNADFTQASDRLADLTREAVDRIGDRFPSELPDADELLELAEELDKWAGNARHDALEVAPIAALLRKARWGNE
jgi:hypothetical protein